MSKEACQQATNIVNVLLAEPDENELLENLIVDEEIYIANVLMKCVKFCPSIFEGPTMNKEEMSKWVQKGSRQIWTHVGGTYFIANFVGSTSIYDIKAHSLKPLNLHSLKPLSSTCWCELKSYSNQLSVFSLDFETTRDFDMRDKKYFN